MCRVLLYWLVLSFIIRTYGMDLVGIVMDSLTISLGFLGNDSSYLDSDNSKLKAGRGRYG